MARKLVQKQIEVCARDMLGKERPATEKRVYALDDRYYEIWLCAEHAAMFDRDIAKWTMLSEEIDNPYGEQAEHKKSQFFTEERVRESKRAAELLQQIKDREASRQFAVLRAAEIKAEQLAASRTEELTCRRTIPGAMKYRLTDHARQRMIERGFTVEDVFNAVAHPSHVTEQPWRSPTIVVAYRGDCRVVVDQANGGIITVIPRDEEPETGPEFYARRARQAAAEHDHQATHPVPERKAQ